jgi:hypothetical protein
MSTSFRPRAWTAADAQNDTAWILRLTPSEADGIHSPLQYAVRAAKPSAAMTQAEFPCLMIRVPH